MFRLLFMLFFLGARFMGGLFRFSLGFCFGLIRAVFFKYNDY